MVEERIGYRYAKSVFDLAREKNIVEDVKDDFQMIRDTADESREFRAFLKSPVINSDKKLRILDSLFKDRYKSELTDHLVDIIVRKHREEYLYYVAAAYLELYDRAKQILRGKLITATPLSDENLARVKAVVEEQTGDTFVVEQLVDPELIGGFVLQLGDKLFDGSVSNELKRLSQEFQQNTYIREF